MSVFVTVEKISFARDKGVAKNHIQSRLGTHCLAFDKKVRSTLTHFDRSFKWCACACMSAPWGVGGSHQVFWHLLLTLQTLVVTSSSSKSPLLGQEIQLTFPRQWEQMLVYHRNALWWPVYLVLPFPSDLCPSKQLLALPIRHARRKQVGHFKP